MHPNPYMNERLSFLHGPYLLSAGSGQLPEGCDTDSLNLISLSHAKTETENESSHTI